MSHRITKYPRTPHVEGSRLQPGDEDLEALPLHALAGATVVVEEKLDGANVGIGFDAAGRLRIQSRGHYLTGGPRERHYALLKTWARAHESMLRALLGGRYLLFGEWLYAKHTIYYDALPHYLLEFDVLDRLSGTFLTTAARRALLQGTPIVSVPVLGERSFRNPDDLRALVRRPLFQTDDWRRNLEAEAAARGLDAAAVAAETDPEPLAEGLYLKVEVDGAVRQRCKFIRRSFLTRITDSGSDWLTRPILPNRLASGVDLFASR